ncbi:MAG: sigma-70 family RNA polymerase sigma factor [Dermatophilaceae bacterium]
MTSAPGESLAERSAGAFAAYQAGERERMGDLVDLLTPILWHTARSQRLDHAAAEDAVQLAWMRLVEHADAIHDPRAVLSWLITTVRREAWRLTRRERRLTVTDELPEADDDGAPAALDPALAAVLNDDQARLWQHVSGLPERCRALLRVVAFVDRPDYAEVSQALGMPVGSIGPTRGRCLAKLRAALLADPTWSAS